MQIMATFETDLGKMASIDLEIFITIFLKHWDLVSLVSDPAEVLKFMQNLVQNHPCNKSFKNSLTYVTYNLPA